MLGVGCSHEPSSDDRLAEVADEANIDPGRLAGIAEDLCSLDRFDLVASPTEAGAHMRTATLGGLSIDRSGEVIEARCPERSDEWATASS